MSGTENRPEADIVLNPGLDRSVLARTFAKSGRIQIRDFMTDYYANATHDVFLRHVPWSLVYNKGKENIELKPNQLATLSREEWARLNRDIVTRARNRFQFRYHAFRILNSYQNRDHPEHPFYGLLEYINGEEFLGFVREVTGLPDLIKADAQATLYMPGDFLTLHEDKGKPEEGWKLAYVMNFAKGWKTDWGGLLQFHSDDGERVIDTFVPRFNALNIFRVPVRHAVSVVSPFAPAGRYAITGWFRCDP